MRVPEWVITIKLERVLHCKARESQGQAPRYKVRGAFENAQQNHWDDRDMKKACRKPCGDIRFTCKVHCFTAFDMVLVYDKLTSETLYSVHNTGPR